MAFNIPIPSHSHLFNSHSLSSHSHTRSGIVVYNYRSLLYGCNIIIDTVQKS